MTYEEFKRRSEPFDKQISELMQTVCRLRDEYVWSNLPFKPGDRCKGSLGRDGTIVSATMMGKDKFMVSYRMDKFHPNDNPCYVSTDSKNIVLVDNVTIS